jgi:hypothetical protein
MCGIVWRIAQSLVLATALSGCVMQYDIDLINHTSKSVLLRMVQYHSETFDGTVPKQFTESLVVTQKEVRLAPNEKSKVTFNSGAGGFWLRWKVLNGSTTQARWSTLDLVRDKPLIHIQ